MNFQSRTLAILNLTGALSPELKEYFISRNILVIDPLVSTAIADWTHIITKDIHDFDLICETYDLIKKDRHLISLSRIDDLKNFTVNNGNLILDDVWFTGNLGPFIMDKYFQGYGGITLGDNYPSFQELGSFNISNPFNTGEYLDRMVQKAFEVGVEALTLKTYFDHLVMYAAGLKKKNKAGLPFEVTYGSYEDVFALQVHFFAEHLELLDVTTSLSSVITKHAEEYFLNTAVQSADFFDFSYMPEVNKVVITGLWTRDERIKFENRGLMVSTLEAGQVFHKFENEGSTSSLIADVPIPDFTERMFFSQNKQGAIDPASEMTVVKDSSEEEQEEVTVVSGVVDETEDEVRIIKGEIDLDEVVTVVKDKFEEEKSIIRVSGSKLDIDQVAYRIAATVDESTKESNLKVRSLGNKIPNLIKTGLYDFAKNISKSVDDLADSDLDQFQVERLPEIIRQGILLQKTEARITEGHATKVQKEVVSDQQKMDLKAANIQNDKLKAQLKNLMTEVRILKENRTKMAEVQERAQKLADESPASSEKFESSEMSLQLYVNKLREQQTLSAIDSKKLSDVLERETKIMAELKEEELKSRKLHIENMQKENLYSQEIEKAQRSIVAKDLLLIKTKETFTKIFEKKDSEINELRHKNEQLSRTLATGDSQAQVQTIRLLEKQNANLHKQLDVYKVKLSSLASKINTARGDDYKEEARKLQMINNQLKNQLETYKKEADKWQSKTSQDNSMILSLKQNKSKLEQQLKKMELSSQKETPQAGVNDGEMKRLQAQNQILENQIKDSYSKMSVLESKIQELLKPQKTLSNNGDETSKVKVAQLENSVKKLTQDLIENRNQLSEAKKETNKLRQEKTALQNRLDKMKKDSLKASAAAAQKGNKKAA